MVVVAVAVAVVVGVMASGAYYALVSPETPGEPDRPQPVGTLVLVEALRNLAVATLVVVLLAASDREGARDGALLGLLLWVLPVVLLAGSIFHEGVLLRSAVVHAGDWLMKLVLIGVITGLIA